MERLRSRKSSETLGCLLSSAGGWFLLLAAVCLSGCGDFPRLPHEFSRAERDGSDASDRQGLRMQSVRPDSFDANDPAEVAAVFLEAVKVGSPSTVRSLLSAAARSGLDEHGLRPQVRARPMAYYQVKSPQFLAEHADGVHVPCVWSEADQPQAREFTLVLRREGNGWRVVGLAQSNGAGFSIYDFESPLDFVASGRTQPASSLSPK